MSTDGPKEVEIKIGVKEGPKYSKVAVKKIVYQGFINRHAPVPANPLQSTCYEQTRKNAILS